MVRRERSRGARSPPGQSGSYVGKSWVKHGHKKLYILGGVALLILIVVLALAGPSPGRIAPDFTLRDANGQEFRLFSILAEKPVIINFISSLNCRSCTVELPNYRQLWATYGARVAMVWISIDPTITDSEIKQFALEKDASWAWAKDTSGVAQKFGVAGFPTMFVVNKSGEIVHEAGSLDLTAVSAVINGLQG